MNKSNVCEWMAMQQTSIVLRDSKLWDDDTYVYSLEKVFLDSDEIIVPIRDLMP
jgi:hypothetical protein